VPITAPAYHIAVVVPDVERAITDLTTALGLSWAAVQRRTNTFESPSGPTPVDMCFVYSLEGPPYLEVIEQREGSIFLTPGLHHVGLWCDDRPGESTRLEELGWTRETVGLASDGKWAGGLFHVVAGLRVEVVDIGRSGPPLCRYLAGGDYR
jgi:hypothetical protein